MNHSCGGVGRLRCTVACRGAIGDARVGITGDARAPRRSSGGEQARSWHLGKQVAGDTTFASKTDARRWLATVEADMLRGIWVDPDAGKIPFREYAERWVAERPVRPRTREISEGQLRDVVTVFDSVHRCDVHPVDVRTWHGRLAASRLHHNTVATIYRLFGLDTTRHGRRTPRSGPTW